MKAADIFKDSLDSHIDDMISQNKLDFEDKIYYKDLYYKAKEQSNIKFLENSLKNERLTEAEKLKIIKQIEEQKLRCQKQAADAAHQYRKNLYKASSVEGKARIKEEEIKAREEYQKTCQERYAQEKALIETSRKSAKQKEKEIKELTDRYHAEQVSNAEALNNLKLDYYNLEAGKQQQNLKNLSNGLDLFKTNTKEGLVEITKSLGKLNLKDLDKEIKNKIEKGKEMLDELDEDYQKLKESGASADELRANRDAYNALAMSKLVDELKSGITSALNQLSSDYDKAFKQAEEQLTQYQSHIDARLQGSEKSYDKMSGLISTNLSLNPYVKTQAVMDNMKKAVDAGISYNVEQRAFLATISDKIANTFDAFDSNLTRLIKLQQADSTAARLGMEASLTKFFNEMFQDTAYLSGTSDQVSAAIIDANAMLTREQSAAFEYIVQKWLGSLASVGMSDESIQTIARGINYLATGDVTNLANNTSMQTLFAMSSAKAGLEYSELLLKGLDASNTNKLLESMVTYLKEIAEGSDNQVVRSAYRDVFDISLTDMKAITNLSQGDIANIAGNTLSYAQMNNEVNSQLNSLSKRVNMAEKLSNLYNNAVYGVAEDMVSNPAMFAMTKMLNFMEESKIDIAIPFVNAAGFGLDLNTSVQDIMRLGIGLGQATSLMTNILGGLFSGGGMDLDSWNAKDTLSRGSLSFTGSSSTLGETSGSVYVGNSSMDDMKRSSLNQATDDAEETRKITNKNLKTDYTFDDFYRATVGDRASEFIKSKDKIFELVYNQETNYLATKDNRFNFSSGQLQVEDRHLRTSLETNVIRVKPEYETLAIHIASIAQELIPSNIMHLAKGTVVKIDPESFIKTYREATGFNEKDEVKNVGDLMEELREGTLVVKIANESGRRIQVDTELSGLSGYVSRINW